MIEKAEKPFIKVYWDEETKAVSVDFSESRDTFVNWSFVSACLGSAQKVADRQQEMHEAIAMQQKMQEAQMAQRVHNQIVRSGH